MSSFTNAESDEEAEGEAPLQLHQEIQERRPPDPEKRIHE